MYFVDANVVIIIARCYKKETSLKKMSEENCYEKDRQANYFLSKGKYIIYIRNNQNVCANFYDKTSFFMKCLTNVNLF